MLSDIRTFLPAFEEYVVCEGCGLLLRPMMKRNQEAALRCFCANETI